MNECLPKLLRSIGATLRAQELRHDVIFNAAADELEKNRARVAELEAERSKFKQRPGPIWDEVLDDNFRLRARVAELEADKEKLAGYGDVLGLRVRQAEARVAELEAERDEWKQAAQVEAAQVNRYCDRVAELERLKCDCGMKS